MYSRDSLPWPFSRALCRPLFSAYNVTLASSRHGIVVNTSRECSWCSLVAQKRDKAVLSTWNGF